MSRINPGVMSSDRDDWETPRDLFDRCDAIWHFDLDAASNDENALCERHFTKEDDGLSQDWSGHTVWCNPPYGREIGAWMEKCAVEGGKPGTVVVALIPNRTDSRWYQQWVLGHADEVVPLAGRVRFCIGGVPGQSAPFPSALVRWGGGPFQRLRDQAARRRLCFRRVITSSSYLFVPA